MRVFLSYSTPDLKEARRFAEALTARRPDLDIYLAPQRNMAGAYWMPILGEELAAADVVLLLVGKQVGPWQQLEYYEALKLWRQSTPQRPLIAPVVLAGNVPGLFVLDHFHCLFFDPDAFEPLVEALLAAFDGAATGKRTPLWSATNPYAGLHAMGTEDAAFFFGREGLTGDVLEQIRTKPDRVLALVGNSGVGKSSVALAGVIASLRSRLWPGELDRPWPEDLADSPTWLPIVFSPGERPVKALAVAFARTWLDDPAEAEAQALKWVENFGNGSDLSDLADAARTKIAERAEAEAPRCFLIYVDQGEELYSRASPENRPDEDAPQGRRQQRATEAELFSTLLADAAARPGFVILTSLRSDYYGRLQADAPLFKASERIDVPPLDRNQIEDVVRKPAARLGARFDNPAVVPLIAEATAREPGALPMLSFLMEDAWERMRSDPAADGALRFPFEIVDVSRPLAERAERFYETHPARQAAIRRLFTLRLAHVPKEGEPVRRRARKSECSVEEWAIAEELTRQEWRLLSAGEDDDGEPFVAVAHEALLRNWPRLGGWLDDAREFLAWKGQLEAARREWDAAPLEKKDGALLMGLALEKARRWLNERGEDLTEADRRYIGRSIDQDEARRTRERRRQQQITWGSVTAAVVLAAVAMFAVAQWQWALTETKRADAERGRAEAALTDAEDARAAAEGAAEQARRFADREAQQRNRAESALQQAEAERDRADQNARSAQDAEKRALRDAQQARDNQAAALAALSSIELGRGRPVEAAKLALAAWPRNHEDATVRLPVALMALRNAAIVMRERLRIESTASVLAVAFSPDGARLATGSRDGTAQLWDAASGAEIARFEGHSGQVNSVAFSPDGARLATGSIDRTARLWDAATGAEIARLEGHGENVSSVAFSPDGAHLATSSNDGTARLWNAANGAEIARLEHSGPVSNVAFSPDGAHLATGTDGYGTARLWDTAGGAEIVRLEGHGGPVSSVAFSPDGARLATGSWDNTARLWDAATGAEIARLEGHGGWVTSVAFSPDGARLATGSLDNTARLWDAASGAEIARLEGHGDDVNSVSFSPDGARLATGSGDGTARLWDAASGAEIARLEGHGGIVYSAAFSPDGARLATGSDDGTARLWDAVSGAEIARLEGHGGIVYSVAFSPDGARLATGSFDGTARLWDAADGAEIARLELGAPVQSVAFSPDGARLATGSGDRTARLWDAASGAEIARLEHGNWVRSVAFSPDGARLATVSGDGTARLWDTAGGAEIARYEGHRVDIRSVAFSPDGTRLATGSGDRTARLWDAASGAEIARLEGHGGRVTSVAFSPDGARLATGSDDRTARLWDAATGAEIARLEGHSEWVNSVAFSPDGARLATGSGSPFGKDNSARIWHTGLYSYDPVHRTGIPSGNIFQIACAWLGDSRDLQNIAPDHQIIIEEPICNFDEGGYDPPLPPWVKPASAKTTAN